MLNYQRVSVIDEQHPEQSEESYLFLRDLGIFNHPNCFHLKMLRLGPRRASSSFRSLDIRAEVMFGMFPRPFYAENVRVSSI